MKHSPQSRHHCRSIKGFNLIEVAVSIGIVGFGLVALLGLMSVALNTTKDTSDDHQVAIIVRQLVADRMGTPYQFATPAPSSIPALDTVPAGSSTTPLYFTKDGTATNAPTSFAHPAYYRAVVILTNMPPAATEMRIRVEWPAKSALTNVSYYSTIIPHSNL